MDFNERKQRVLERISRTKHLTENEQKAFSEWLDLQKDWFDYSKKGLVFCARSQWSAYKIYKKLHTTEQHHIELITGDVGKGKSTLAWQRCASIDPNFSPKNLIYTHEDFFRAILDTEHFKRGSALWIDEGGRFFNASRSNSKDSADLKEMFQDFRVLGYYVCICFDDPRNMQLPILTKADSLLYKKYNSTGKNENEQLRYSVLYGKSKVKEIATKLKSTKKDILKLGVRGTDVKNTAHYPMINGWSEEIYAEKKERNIRDRAKQKLEDLGVSLVKDPDEEKKGLFITTTEATKYLPISRQAIINRILKKEIRGYKNGNWFVLKSDILNLIPNDSVEISVIGKKNTIKTPSECREDTDNINKNTVGILPNEP